MKIVEIIKELEEINKEFETTRFSIITAAKLIRLSNELKQQAKEVWECCF